MSVENPIESVPECLRPNLQLYRTMFVVIDGYLQAEESSVDVRIGPDRRRVYVRWAVPVKKLEWDGRPYVGTDRTCRVQVLQGDELAINADMRCIWFAVSHGVNQHAVARAIFECGPVKHVVQADSLPPIVAERQPKNNAFGYTDSDRRG